MNANAELFQIVGDLWRPPGQVFENYIAWIQVKPEEGKVLLHEREIGTLEISELQAEALAPLYGRAPLIPTLTKMLEGNRGWKAGYYSGCTSWRYRYDHLCCHDPQFRCPVLWQFQIDQALCAEVATLWPDRQEVLDYVLKTWSGQSHFDTRDLIRYAGRIGMIIGQSASAPEALAELRHIRRWS